MREPSNKSLSGKTGGQAMTSTQDEREKHIASLRSLSAWLIANDHDMKLPDDVIDPDLAADFLASLPTPDTAGEVVADEHSALVAAGFDDYAARCALRTEPDGGFCHAYLYSDGQWRFQTGGSELHQPDGKVLQCVLIKRLYAAPQATVTGGKFKLGDRVTKTKGSKWTGRVVGFYSTTLTAIGYAVESETETGSVQIYPEAALTTLTGAAEGGV